MTIQRVTKRTKLDVAETLRDLYHCAMATKPEEHDKWLITRGIEVGLGIASGYARGAYDHSRFNEPSEMVDVLSDEAKREIVRYRDAVSEGREPWQQ